RDLGAYCLRFIAQTSAYLLFLTDRYPQLGSGGQPIAPEVAVNENLRKLEDLRQAGIISDEEFEEKRRLLLADFESGV
ncbi:MAG: SHOCT domain-containing protein, partial [Actinomycetota bacterium]|nr:SHOCT domain-containing protein [Actinomycetota bacterium]